MNKETLIKKLLNEKAETNNTIDLNAYALGLDAMYEALLLHDVSCQREQLLAFAGWLYGNSDKEVERMIVDDYLKGK